MMMMRIRLGLLIGDLADCFGVSEKTCSQTFLTWVKVISRKSDRKGYCELASL